MDKSRQILSDIIIHMKYAKYLPSEKRRETWEEIIERNMDMHIKKYPELKEEIIEAYKYVFDKKVLPSMRSLQFAGKAVEKNPIRMYNCGALAMAHTDAFKELTFLLASGTGVGYSVQFHHIKQLPEIQKAKKERRFLIGDSIEGWAEAVGVLIDSYFGVRKSKPRFDFSDIREKGKELKTSGGKAPGPEPLKECLYRMNKILRGKENGEQLSSLEIHDINCHIADCIVSGGTRRSSCICLFSFNDKAMIECKFGNWFEENPQRARANNTAVILRHKIKEEEFREFFRRTRNAGFGEPGWAFSNDSSYLINPCGEVSLKTDIKSGSGQLCNLVEINASNITSQEDFNDRARAASFIATLQAGYTDFHFIRDSWTDVTEEEALIGVGITGISTGNILNFKFKEASEIVKKENERVSNLIGINKASRCTVIKPSGTSSLVLGCSSGIHSWHSDFYIRRIRIGKDEPLYLYLEKNHKELLEDDYFKPTTQAVISIPIKAPEDSITRKETALQFLDRIKRIYKNWILSGHRKGHNTNNISATVTVKENEWERVENWMWENRDSYTAITVLPYDHRSYVQPPFEEIDEEKYNEMFQSLRTVDVTKVKEREDNTTRQQEPSCASGSCEVV